MRPFQLAFHHALPHGVLSAVELPDRPDPVPEEVLAELHPDEAEYARTLKGYRQVSWVGGRLAARQAGGQLGMRLGALPSAEDGCPAWPGRVTGSISHKGDLAIALLRRDTSVRVGVDLEDYGPARPSIASRILVPEELAALDGLDEQARWIATVLRFSIKESIYKALHPFVRRYIAFSEAVVTPDLHGAAEVELRLTGGEGPFELEARYAWVRGRIVTSVTARPV